jgi:ribosomal protein L37AE/L43A
MMVRPRTPTCDNMNHRRPNAPVAHCVQCGAVVNDRLSPGRCEEQRHAEARRRQLPYCADCGQQLILPR